MNLARFPRPLVLAALVAPGPLAAQPVPSPSAPTPTLTPSPATAGTAAGASAAPSAPGTTAPDAYKYRFVPRQPANPAPGTPQIFAVYVNDQTLHSSGPIWIKVQTSPDVVKVVNRNEGHEYAIPQIVAGDFEAFSKLPKVPFIAAGMTVYLEIVASGPTGTKTTVRVPVKLQ